MSHVLYDTDFYLWTRQQAELLRQGQLQSLDFENLAEEIESMGKSDRRAVESYLGVIILHLLKWRYQGERRGNSWRLSIDNGRYRLARRLKDSPSLKAQVAQIVEEEYAQARKNATGETGLPLGIFPERCPFTVEQVLGDWWPE